MSRSTDDASRYRDNMLTELDAAALYDRLAEAESHDEVASVYRRLAVTERRHANMWRDRLERAGGAVPSFRPSRRTRVLGWLARRFGPSFVLPALAAVEQGAGSEYLGQPEAEAAGMAADERFHAKVFTALAGEGRGLSGGAVARLEGRHRSMGGNALRAGVLGGNDGLVSNLSLVMGVAGAEMSGSAVLVTGIAGLLAGALSMALGEWLSVQSSRELYERQIGIEAAELRDSPEEEMEELALIYQAKGVGETEARSLAERLLSDTETALDTLAREELGIDPDELGGSAWEAALTSFGLFAAGAIIPVLPFFVLEGPRAVITSLGLSTVGLFAIGAGMTLVTGRGVWRTGLRQVVFGLAAAAITFGIGRLIGVSVVG